jgi:hypothetical protein
VQLFQTPGFRPQEGPAPVLVVDETGVGVPVVENLRLDMARAQVDGHLIAVTITAGDAVSNPEPARWRVAKKQLASVLMTLFGAHRLEIVDMPGGLRDLLIREAQSFTTKIAPEGDETVEAWRDAENDDLVLALALACWAAVWIHWPKVLPWPPVRKTSR